MKTQHTGRAPLCWLVVSPAGKLLAILDSESEAYWFTRNRGHATGAVYFKAPCDYASAPELLTALEAAVKYLEANRPKGKTRDIFTQLNQHENAALKPARAAIAKATGQP